MSANAPSESNFAAAESTDRLPAEGETAGQEFPSAAEQRVPRPAQGMTSDKVDFLLMNFKGLVPETGMPALRNALLRADESAASRIMLVPLKNPTTTLLFSIFLGEFGVDRFYVGDVGLGVGKLLVGWMTSGIWPFIDIFFCYKKARQKNLETLLAALR